MTAHIPVIAATAVVLSIGAASSIGAALDRKERRQKEAERTWSDIVLRNGVSARIPWHEPASGVNVPALVEVNPRSKQADPPIHPWEVSVMPEEVDSTSVPGVGPLVNEPPSPVLELAEELTSEERARVTRLFAGGMGKHATILEVWGIKKGGSKKFKQASERYEQIKSEVLTNA